MLEAMLQNSNLNEAGKATIQEHALEARVFCLEPIDHALFLYYETTDTQEENRKLSYAKVILEG